MAGKGSDPVAMKDVREVRSLPKPPQMVKNTVAAIFVVLGEDRRNAENWKYVTKEMSKTGTESFIERLKRFDPATVTAERAQYANDAALRDSSVAKIKCISASISSLFAWLENTVQASGQGTKEDNP